MSSDQLPPGFAPYHVVRIDVPRAQGAGKFYDLGIAASTLDFLRLHCPEGEWGILSDGGLIDDTKIVRKPMNPMGGFALPTPPTFRKFTPYLLRKTA